jgi:hypothetical protein
MPALWRERPPPPCGFCHGRGPERRDDAEPYALLPSADEDPVQPRRLWQPCPCGKRWAPFVYDDCFRGMGFVAGKTPPRGFHGVIFAAGLPSHVARHIYDRIRHLHADAVRDEGWERYFDEATRAALKDALEAFIEEQRAVLEEQPSRSCFLNLRAAEKRKPRQVRRFKAERDRADDWSVAFQKEVTLGGRVFLIGFNMH